MKAAATMQEHVLMCTRGMISITYACDLSGTVWSVKLT